MVAAVLILLCFVDTFLTGVLLVKHQALVKAHRLLTDTVAELEHDVILIGSQPVSEVSEGV